MTHSVIHIDPRATTVPLLLPAGKLGDPQRLHRKRRVDHLLRPVHLRGKIHRRQVVHPGPGVLETLTHQCEGLRKLVEHVSYVA